MAYSASNFKKGNNWIHIDWNAPYQNPQSFLNVIFALQCHHVAEYV